MFHRAPWVSPITQGFFVVKNCIRNHNMEEHKTGPQMNKIITGDTAVFTFAILYPGAVDGIPAPDLSNDTIKFALKNKLTGKIYGEKTLSNPDTNIISFTLTPEETSVLSPGIYEGCLKIYYDNNATTVWAQEFIVIKGVLDA